MIDHLERNRCGQTIDYPLHEGKLGQIIPRPLQKKHRDLDRSKMICTSGRRLFGCVKGKSKKTKSENVG